ncbi:Retrovirus-related Pol poly from transposon [Paramuricea clavata]|uniref:Retrovirus-related Pol poly from transposon n=1 Tax=Paramuricea clavata TaxID=317549 RepID=A0A7D9IAI9_PARCT|nr:Retrovirus-related Pol poly from transposon [Paramuricea clavata]
MFFVASGNYDIKQLNCLLTKITQRQRRIPFHLRAKVDAELSQLQDEDIIERVPDTEATEWISPIVIMPKNTTIFAYFLQPKLEFFGLNFSADGVCPDPNKVSALATAAMPTTGSEEQDHAYNTVQKALINSPMMSYFDVNKATEVTVDASPVSVILAQRDSLSSPPNIVAYASRALTSTDTNPADYLSRHPPDSKQKQTNIADKYVHFVTHTAVLPALTVDDGRKDTLLSLVRTAIQTGQWSSSELKEFKPIKDELSIDYTNNVVLRGTRLVIPSSLVQCVIQLAHEGHQGQARTKALIREHVWFPEMDKTELEKCLACQATGQPSQPEPLSTPLPNKASNKLKIDFHGPLQTGQYILVILDCYSQFPEVEVLSSISAKSVIPKLDAVFARHGVPSQVVSDNGQPFQGHQFNRYMTKMGIQHNTSTPLWPQGNAEVEAFMKPLGKAIRTANLEGRSWKQELSKFLLAYQSTPPPIRPTFLCPLSPSCDKGDQSTISGRPAWGLFSLGEVQTRRGRSVRPPSYFSDLF